MSLRGQAPMRTVTRSSPARGRWRRSRRGGAPRAGRTPPVSPQWAETPSPRGEGSARPARLLTVAMMRPGDKLASYRLLAEALGRLGERPWQLTIVGDGPERAMVEALFTPFGERVRLAGRVDDAGTLARLYAGADLFVWPAVNEAYGMVLLEAQAEGCPVVAGGEGGVASVVRRGETGLLTPARDADAFAAAVAGLIEDGARRERMAAAARRFVQGERSLGHAAMIIADALSAIGVRP
ncbi:glycosyltransferase family 4 protein [Chelatococcus daeguensis]|nr:glycosyltransferase family 4 protein [Chelatococcus daeguensis]